MQDAPFLFGGNCRYCKSGPSGEGPLSQNNGGKRLVGRVICFCFPGAVTAIPVASGTMTGTGLAVGAADTLNALFLLLINVPDDQEQERCDGSEDHKINQFHKDYLLLNAYSEAKPWLVFLIMLAIIMPITTTTAKPRMAATMFRDAGAVISVPMV